MKKLSLTLEIAEKQFSDWRAQKKPGENIPDWLWAIVKQLIPHYKIGQITTRLRLSIKQLRQKGLLPNKLSPSIKRQLQSFCQVELLPNSTAIDPNTKNVLVLERSDELKLSVVSPTEAQLNLLITQFLS